MFIKCLTKKQKKQMNKYAKKWNRIAISTKPIKKSKVRAAVDLLYVSSKFEPPKEIVWCASPKDMVDIYLKYERISEKINKGCITYDIYGVNSHAQWEASVNISVNLALGTCEDGYIIWDSICFRWDDLFLNWIYKDIDKALNLYNGICNDSINHIGLKDYMKNTFTMDTGLASMSGIIQMAKVAGLYIPCKDVCYVSERPCEINTSLNLNLSNVHLGKDDKIYNDASINIKWEDGWELNNSDIMEAHVIDYLPTFSNRIKQIREK